MKKSSKINKIFGYILIIIGLIILTIPFARRIYSEVENKKVYEKVIQTQKENPEKIDQIEEKAKEYNKKLINSDIAMVDPFLTKDNGSTSILENQDDIFAYVNIPKLEINLPLYLDASYEHLDLGLAQVTGTAIPVGGKSTRSVIAGHRGWWGASRFLYAHTLENGDKIYINRADKTLTYEVYEMKIIDPYNWESLRIIPNEDIITLLTCHPLYNIGASRLIVNAKRVEEEKKEQTQIEEKIEKVEVSTTVKIAKKMYVVIVVADILLILFLIYKIIKTVGMKN